MPLADRKCEEPRPGQKPMTPDEADKLVFELQGWTVKNSFIEREFRFNDFREAIDFIDAVADIAEDENHHPTIHNTYNKVKLELTTHKVGGLSMNDFILAAKIDELLA